MENTLYLQISNRKEEKEKNREREEKTQVEEFFSFRFILLETRVKADKLNVDGMSFDAHCKHTQRITQFNLQ